jgi:hypothetical protein
MYSVFESALIAVREDDDTRKKATRRRELCNDDVKSFYTDGFYASSKEILQQRTEQSDALTSSQAARLPTKFSTPLVASPTTAPDCHAGVLISIPFADPTRTDGGGSPAMRLLAALEG